MFKSLYSGGLCSPLVRSLLLVKDLIEENLPTYLTVNNGTVTQGTTVAGNIVCTFTASDADDDLTFSFTEGTNTNGYYVISGFNVLLTTAGKTFLDAFNKLPNVSITTNTGVTVSNTITTTSRYYMRPNGTSTYITIPLMTLATGDTVEFSFIAEGQNFNDYVKMLTGDLAYDSTVEVSKDDKLYRGTSTWSSFSLDGVVISNSSVVIPKDGLSHTLKLTAIAGAKLRYIHHGDSASAYGLNPLYNLSITAAQGNRFYPIDDGFTANGVIRETLQGLNGTLVNGASSNWHSLNTIASVNVPSRNTPKLDGLTNYYKLDTPKVMSGDFYFSGYFTIDGSTHLAASYGASTGRIGFASPDLMIFAASSTNNTVTTTIPAATLAENKVYFIECYRLNNYIFWKVNGVIQGSTSGTYRNETLTIDSFGAQWSAQTSMPYQSGYMYDVTLGSLGDTEFFSLNSPFSDYPSNIFGDKGTRLTGYNFVSSQIEKKALGIELLKDNDFNSHDNWLTQGASVVLTQNATTLTVTSPNFEGIRQAVKTEAGKKYKVRWRTKTKTNTLFIRVYDTAEFGTLIKEVTSDTLQGFMTFTALSDNSNLYLRNTTTGTTEWDYITMTEMDI